MVNSALLDGSYFLILAASQPEQSTGNDDLRDADEAVAVEEVETVVGEGSEHGDPAVVILISLYVATNKLWLKILTYMNIASGVGYGVILTNIMTNFIPLYLI